MTDEVSQLPLPLLEESSPQDELPDQGEIPEGVDSLPEVNSLPVEEEILLCFRGWLGVLPEYSISRAVISSNSGDNDASKDGAIATLGNEATSKRINLTISLPRRWRNLRLPPRRTRAWIVSMGIMRPVAPGEGPSKKLGEVLGAAASVMVNATVVEKILIGVILPPNKEKVDKLSLDQAMELEGLLAEFSEREQNTTEEMAKLRDDREAIAEKLRQLAYHHPNLGIDLDGMDMDCNLLEKKMVEADEHKEQGEGIGDTSPLSP
ncbi:hypothetical protein Acr_00g0010990 [Actinidia rufa]|uniref:Uncharacterized protein n=1 Tax=Actinidia rufa TaxID=165716 RepID=A0A7J0D9B5_9ERIC|nr:hypothetical protein Acr_00g0010990 [Actinidia rufa]